MSKNIDSSLGFSISVEDPPKIGSIGYANYQIPKGDPTGLGQLAKALENSAPKFFQLAQAKQKETDQEQFGKEKFCLTEETLHYPFADCEDRTFLLNRLIQTFTNWKTVGIRFPNHLALAVELEPETGMDVLRYKGRKWVYCDPTYFGADVGRVPAQYQLSAWEAVE